MVLPSEEPPPCLSDVEQSRRDAGARAPLPIRRCRYYCPHFDTARARAGTDPSTVRNLQQDYDNGRFMNCPNRL